MLINESKGKQQLKQDEDVALKHWYLCTWVNSITFQNATALRMYYFLKICERDKMCTISVKPLS
jgi:hypothetical protein